MAGPMGGAFWLLYFKPKKLTGVKKMPNGNKDQDDISLPHEYVSYVNR